MMKNPVLNQIKQRAAVRAAKQRALVRVGSTRFGDGQRLYLVYVNGEAYIANDVQLTALRQGDAPEDVGVAQPADENEPFEGY